MSSELQASIDRIAEEHRFSGILQVTRGGELLCEHVGGFADRAHRIANTRETRFAIASGTKGFTALTVMSLVAEGSIGLDAPVRSVLGDALELIDADVTIAQLLGHTSGIGDYLDEESFDDVGGYLMPVPVHRLATTRDFVPILDGHPSKFPPGERFSYCNGGYVVLALVAEIVGGASFHDLADERVFRPAGMVDTAFLRSDELPGTAALGYLDIDGLRTNVLHLPVRGTGDGGAYTTVADIAAFWDAVFAGRIVPRAIVDEMVRPRSDVPREEKRYGLGFWVRRDRETPMLEGYDAGVSFRTAYDPPSRVSYTLISNTSEGAWDFVELLDDALPGLVVS